MRLLPALTVAVPVLFAPSPQTATCAGKVLGPGGQPVAGAIVAAVPATGSWEAAHRVYTEKDGTFRLEIPAGPFGLTATRPGLREAFLGNLTSEPGRNQEGLILQLTEGGHAVSGYLVDREGKPIADGQVAFLRFSKDEGDVFFAHMLGNQFAITLGPGSYLMATAAPGRFPHTESIELASDCAGRRVVMEVGPSAAGAEVKAWIKREAIPLQTAEAGKGFQDLAPFNGLVGPARVVSLGEATHGTREFFQMKHRMLEFLVERMGFTVFAIEASMPEARAVDEYVLEGRGDPAKALSGLHFWTWDTEEVLAMIRWMRRYNEDPRHSNKVRFYGFDMQFPSAAYAAVRTYLDRVDAEGAAWLEKHLGELSHSGGSKPLEEARGKALLAEVQALLARFDARQDAYAKATGGDAYAWARQDARVLAQYTEMAAHPTDDSRVRDLSMAENVQWILNQEKGAKAVLWAHNGHVSFDPKGAIAGAASMGLHLHRALGKDMVVFGFSFLEGGFQAVDGGKDKLGLVPFEVKPNPDATLTQALASAGQPILVLDLRKLPAQGPVHDWFSHPQGHLVCGAGFATARESAYIAKDKVPEQFDALFFMAKTTAARPNGSGKRETAQVRAFAAAPMNLGFEEGALGQLPAGWRMPPPFVADGFQAELIQDAPREGKQALRLSHRTGDSSMGWGNLMQSVDARPYRGKKVRLSGWIRTDGRPESKASFWLRVDTEHGRGFFDNAQTRAISATDWTPLEIEGRVDPEASSLNFGCAVWGAGGACFDGIRIEVTD